MRYLSVCSGIEAATVAWHPLGWQAAAYSEIEKRPRAVLAHHYPNVPLHGDFTTIKGDEYGSIGLLVGGTPCQAFSLAGLRNSLDDARGNLTLEFVRLADRIEPEWIVWENVPGVLNTKDNAFGCFLGGLAGEDGPLLPPGGRWSNAGYVLGPKRAIAWRILDAQYFGVAQRRRRVFVVACPRGGFDPREVLFEREGVRRDSPPGRSAGQKIAGTITRGIGERGADDPERGTLIAFGGNNQSGPIDVSTALNACSSASGRLDFESETFIANVAGTLNANGRAAGSATQQDAESGMLIAHAIQAGATRTNPESGPDGVGVQADLAYTLEARAEVQMVAHTLRAEGHDASEDGTGRGVPLIPVAFDCKAGGNTSFAVGEIVGALRGEGAGGGHAAIAFSCKDYGSDAGEVAPTLRSMGHAAIHANAGGQLAVAVSLRGRDGGGAAELGGEVMPALRASGGGGDKPYALTRMAVRRLTPRECERLQGFPDDYTLIPLPLVGRQTRVRWMADGPRYKMLGNSMAVPVMAWIGQRINRLVLNA